jgi:hypothetical protein
MYFPPSCAKAKQRRGEFMQADPGLISPRLTGDVRSGGSALRALPGETFETDAQRATVDTCQRKLQVSTSIKRQKLL